MYTCCMYLLCYCSRGQIYGSYLCSPKELECYIIEQQVCVCIRHGSVPAWRVAGIEGGSRMFYKIYKHTVLAANIPV